MVIFWDYPGGQFPNKLQDDSKYLLRVQMQVDAAAAAGVHVFVLGSHHAASNFPFEPSVINPLAQVIPAVQAATSHTARICWECHA